MRDKFIVCARRKNVSQSIAKTVFEQLAAFAAYGFCKAHAVAYAVLSYKTLWLKYHYPAEFFAALLSNQPMGYYPPRVLIAEARRCGVEVLPLDINRSLDRYSVENGAIRVGLNQLKGITAEAVENILRERKGGEFSSLRDLVLRADLSQPILENLIKVGALDSSGDRRDILLELPSLLKLRRKIGKHKKPLFEEITPETSLYIGGPCNDRKEKLLAERELLSLDISAHPLEFFNLTDDLTKIKDLPLEATGKTVRIVGSVIRYQIPPTRNGKRVVYIIMEDGTGVASITVFSDIQEKCGHVLFRAGWLIVEGKIQRRGKKALSIIAQGLSTLRVN